MGRKQSLLDLFEQAVTEWPDVRVTKTCPMRDWRKEPTWTWHVEGMDYRPKSGKEYRFSGRTLAAALRKAIRAGRKVNREWHKKNPPKRLGKKPRR
jgi:hypothetical protein